MSVCKCVFEGECIRFRDGKRGEEVEAYAYKQTYTDTNLRKSKCSRLAANTRTCTRTHARTHRSFLTLGTPRCLASRP